VQGNLIGTDVTGSLALGNSGFGIEADSNANTIGGTSSSARNVISGNGGNGIQLDGSSGNVVEGNYIGTDANGSIALGNGGNGVTILAGSQNVIGGTVSGSGNLISANAFNGVAIANNATANAVEGNLLGTDATGTMALGNGLSGVALEFSFSNTIGGTAAGAGNVISGNQFVGVYLTIQASGNYIQGDLIGTDITGTRPLGNIQIGVLVELDAGNNTIGGTTVSARNIISANHSEGIELSSTFGDLVEGNYIGIDATGTTALGNGTYGIDMNSVPANITIGGTVAGSGNLISGNGSDGIFLRTGTGATTIEGNRIGTDVTGTHALGNGGSGIRVEGSAFSTIGGTVSGSGNLISGNAASGIWLEGSSNMLVQQNTIGTDTTGTFALGNGGNGVTIDGSDNTIGGPTAGAGNLISGNLGDGLFISSSNNSVQGNLIGTDASGTHGLGNSGNGVTVLNASGNTIGGTTSSAADVISANVGSGILISGANATSNLIAGNFIGTDLSATINLGNAANGVTIRDSSNNTIGGTAAGAGNTVAYNGHDGIQVDTGSGNGILSDLIFSSGYLGIELINNGNNNQAAPWLFAAIESGSATLVAGVLISTPNTTFTLQFFADPHRDPSGLGEARQLLGTFSVTSNAYGIAVFAITIPVVVPPGQILTATATDPNNNTSEFSLPVRVWAGAKGGQAVLAQQQPLGALFLGGGKDAVSQTLSPLGRPSQLSARGDIVSALWTVFTKKVTGETSRPLPNRAINRSHAPL
jgi:titin